MTYRSMQSKFTIHSPIRCSSCSGGGGGGGSDYDPLEGEKISLVFKLIVTSERKSALKHKTDSN